MPRRGLAGIGAVVMSLLLAPIASAAEGTFAVTGPITFPLGTESTLTPFAVYVGNAALIKDLNLTMPEADGRIATWTFQVLSAPAGPEGIIQPVFIETGYVEHPLRVKGAAVRVLSGAVHQAFIGIYPDDATFTVISRDGAPLRPQSSFAIGGEKSTVGEDARSIWYYVAEERPNLYLNTSGVGAYDGRGIIKISGLEIALSRGDSPAKVYKTGWSQVSATEFNLTVLTFDFTLPATLTFDTGATTVEVAAADALSVGDGAVLFRPTAGKLRAAAGDFLPPERPAEVRLDGRFSARTLPLPQEGMAEFVVSGEIEPLGFVHQPAPAGSASRALSWLPLVLLGAALLVGGGGVAVWRHRRRPRTDLMPRPLPPPTAAQPPGVDVEELAPPVLDVEFAMRAARKFVDEEEWERALSWFRYAKGCAPTSTRLLVEEGFCLTRLGRYPEAEEAFETAYRRGVDPESIFGIIGAIDEAGHPVEKLELWIQRYLKAFPGRLWSIEYDFREKLEGRESWMKIVDATLEDLEKGWDSKRS